MHVCGVLFFATNRTTASRKAQQRIRLVCWTSLHISDVRVPGPAQEVNAFFGINGNAKVDVVALPKFFIARKILSVESGFCLASHTDRLDELERAQGVATHTHTRKLDAAQAAVDRGLAGG